MTLTQKPITLISGGHGGLGQALARAATAAGQQVIIIDLHQSATADFIDYACDITDNAAVTQTIEQILQKYGHIDHLVHAAVSPLIRKKPSAITAAEFQQQFAVTTFGGFNLCQAVLPAMRAQKYGRIVGITTVALEPNVTSSSLTGYLSAKFALRGFLRELAREVAADGITVNAVAPDFVATALNSDLPPRATELWQDKKPTKKLVTPEDVATAVMFFLSPTTAAITNVSLPVSYGDGGNL